LNWAQVEATNVLSELGTDGIVGLNDQQVKRRLENNTAFIEPSAIGRVIKLLFRQIINPFSFLLIGSATISLIIGHLNDAIFILIVLIVNIGIGFYQEYKTDHAIRNLKSMVPEKSHVVRDGQIVEVGSDQLVLGDIVTLTEGERVPADIRIIHEDGLEIDESQLTGESKSVVKSARAVSGDIDGKIAPNIVYWGTLIVSGHGRGVVIAVGENVRFAKTLEEAEKAVEEPSIIENEVRKIAKYIIFVAVAASVAVFALAIYRSYEIKSAAVLMINILVAAVPEGLPIIVTIILTVAAHRMSRKKVLVRRLAAAEMLGNVDILLTDKTGTLTEGEMSVSAIWCDRKLVKVLHNDYKTKMIWPDSPSEQTKKTMNELMVIGALSGNAHYIKTLNGSKAVGDAVDLAMMELAVKSSVGTTDFQEWPVISEIPFSSHKRYAAKIIKRSNRKYIFVKGAPEKLIDRAKTIILSGHKVPLKQDIVDNLHSVIKELAQEGKRIIAVGYKDYVKDTNKLYDVDIREITLLGFVGIEDAPRSNVNTTLKELRLSGLEVKLVTGDMPTTAHAIASEVGLIKKTEHVIEGDKFERYLTQGQKWPFIRNVSVFARMTPEMKYELVKFYQSLGLRIAVTGDGVNDAAALKAAEVGIAFAGTGGDVAKQTADSVLLDNNFSTLAYGLTQGRTIWHNIRKVLFFLLSTNSAELAVIILSLIIGIPAPFTALQLLWINLVTDMTSAQALAIEPSERKVMKLLGKHVMDKVLLRRIIVAAIWQTIVVMGIYGWAMNVFTPAEANSMAFVAIVFVQLFNLVNSKSITESIFTKGIRRNWWLIASMLLTLALTMVSLYYAPLAHLLSLQSLAVAQLIQILLISSSIIGVMEIDKILTKKKSI